MLTVLRVRTPSPRPGEGACSRRMKGIGDVSVVVDPSGGIMVEAVRVGEWIEATLERRSRFSPPGDGGEGWGRGVGGVGWREGIEGTRGTVGACW